MPKPKGVARLVQPRHPLRNVALAVDWQGDNDDDITVVTAGADIEWLVEIFTSLCKSRHGIARGFRIESQQPPMWRNGYVNERLAVVLEGCRRDVLLSEGLLMIVKMRMERYVNGGHVDCYELDDLLNLSKRAPEKIITPKPVPTAELHKTKQRKRKKQKADGAPKDEESINTEEMANIYLRVPWYVAAYYRGRDENKPLSEWDPVEFADYTHEFSILENNLRFLPEQVQSRNCYSQRAWNNILHGRSPDGSKMILRRNPDEWPSIQEVSTLIGAACHGKQSGSEYLAIKMPREVFYNRHTYRTTANYCLSYDIGIYLSAMLTRKFCYEYLEWTEYRKEFCRRQGFRAKTIDIVEMFFTQFNFPAAILPTERESLRRYHTRWISNARKRPAYHYQFDDTGFLEHLSKEDLERVEREKKKKDSLI